MNGCPTCGHQNPAAFTVCARCGASLPGGAQDEVARLMSEQDKARRRTRIIYMAVGAVAVSLLLAYGVLDRMKKASIGKKLAWLDEWAEKDKVEVGGLWNCITQSNTPLDSFSNANQVQAKIESAAMVQPKTFAEHLRTECGPNADAVVTAFDKLGDVPEAFAPGFTAYKAALPKLREGMLAYAEGLEQRLGGADLSSRIQAAGEEWHASTAPTPDGIAFERFLQCAVPGIGKLKDAQGVLQVLADHCYKKDAVAFWQTVQDNCGKLLSEAAPTSKPSATYKASVKKFYEPEQRMMSAWQDCARKGHKGSRDDALSPFLQAFGQYMEARAQIARAAKSLADGL